MGTENTGTSQRVHHGHNIASARRMKGLVQKTLADLLGMSQQRLSQIESTKIVSDEILQKVAEITGVSLEDLKTMEEPMSIYIENNSTNKIEKGANVGSVNSSYDENDNDFETTYHVNPIDKITELYERLLKADQEKIKELEQRIAELEGNASKS